MANPDDAAVTDEYRRRTVLKGTTAGAVSLALAGCIGGGDGDGDGGGDGGDGGGDGGDGSDGGSGTQSTTVPGIYDESGATSDVGRPTALGSRDTIAYINESDEFDIEIEHPNNDYAYDVPQAQQYYQEYTSGSEPPMIIGWGTADTEALAGKVADDEVVYISASYSANLLTEEFPYNFFGNLDYTSQARAHLKWIADNDPDAKIAFIFSNTAFGQAPVEGGKQYAEELGLEVGADIDLPLTANSATTQLRQAKNQDIDYLIHQNTSAPMRVLLEDRQDVYPEVTVCGLTYTVDERVVADSPDTFEGARYVNSFRTFEGALESGGLGADIIEANFEREGRDMDDPQVAQLNYVRGVIHALLALKGLQNAADAGNDITSGSNARQGMFGIEDDDMFGLSQSYTFEEGDRRPTMTGRLFEVSDGSLSFDTTVDLPRRDEWIGL
ncbi:ABC transporter substrate-binding protein [Halobacteriales archaeon Cl-PHB]